MKVIAYGIQTCEREFLATANQKKHDITLIANPLSEATLFYAADKQAVIVTDEMTVADELAIRLSEMGVAHVLIRAHCTPESHASILQDMAANVIDQLDQL